MRCWPILIFSLAVQSCTAADLTCQATDQQVILNFRNNRLWFFIMSFAYPLGMTVPPTSQEFHRILSDQDILDVRGLLL